MEDKLVINATTKEIKNVLLTHEEILKREKELILSELDQSSRPSQPELEEAEFELKLITKLTEWGVF